MEVATVLLGCLLLVPWDAAAEPAELSQPPESAALMPPIITTSPEDAQDAIPPSNAWEVTPATSIQDAPSAKSMERSAGGMKNNAAIFSETTGAPGNTGVGRVNPPLMVADAMVLPAKGKVSGQSVTLLQALSSTPDRRRQYETARAYWRLAQAVADDRFCADHAERLARLSGGGDAAMLRGASASAAALVREAEMEVVEAQCNLASLMMWPADAVLPLPADRPYAGAYRTSFQELFAGRVPPERTQLIDRLLPILRQVVDERAAAVLAAEDAFDAVVEVQASGQAGPAALIQSSELLLRQRRAFIRTVCDYNQKIAEYGFTVAAPGASPQLLVAMLIGPPVEAVKPVMARANNGVAHGGAFTEYQDRASLPIGSQRVRNEPTRAKRPNPPAQETPASQEETDVTQTAPSASWAPSDETPAQSSDPAQEKSISVTVQKPTLSLQDAPVEPWAASATAEQNPGLASPLYPGLADATPAALAEQLTQALHVDRFLPENAGRPLKLDDCLLRSQSGNIRAAIEAFWTARHWAAQYQAMLQQAAWLDALTPVALEHGRQSVGMVDRLRLQADASAAKAAADEAHGNLIEAQYALAGRTGMLSEPLWPLAATPPHSGKYLLKLEAQPRPLVASWPIRRLAAKIPTLSESVQQRAAAVVEADAARADFTEQYCHTGASLDSVLNSIRRQSEQTSEFLETLTDYNLAIADYALAVLPAGSRAENVAAALVVKP